MTAQFLMFDPPIFEDIPNATSLPASEDGPTPFNLPAGPTIEKSGPDHAHVSRFRARDSKKVMPTNDTSGPLFTTLLPSADLQLCLESRLRANLDVNGSPECALIWRDWDMPSGPPICRLQASARRTSDTGSGSAASWGTLTAQDGKYATRVTPQARDYKGPQGDSYKGKSHDLPGQAAGQWPTPSSRDGKGGYSGGRMRNGKLSNDTLDVTVQHTVANWATPTLSGNYNRKGLSAKSGDGLGTQVRPSSEQTERPGALNPQFVCWLMGFPPEWVNCAPSATPSSRK
jgi:hypothetical protein